MPHLPSPPHLCPACEQQKQFLAVPPRRPNPSLQPRYSADVPTQVRILRKRPQMVYKKTSSFADFSPGSRATLRARPPGIRGSRSHMSCCRSCFKKSFRDSASCTCTQCVCKFHCEGCRDAEQRFLKKVHAVASKKPFRWHELKHHNFGTWAGLRQNFRLIEGLADGDKGRFDHGSYRAQALWY